MTMELIAGAYVTLVIVLGLVLDQKRGTPFIVVYVWGAAIWYIGTIIYQGTTRADIDPVDAVIAILVTSFAVYTTATKGRG